MNNGEKIRTARSTTTCAKLKLNVVCRKLTIEAGQVDNLFVVFLRKSARGVRSSDERRATKEEGE